mmetsp:Transcript_21071/g.50815  ORF Transcript_21071/g.50815 Transcript_21071/m.50815 type:complete len:214 (-) Transcript_21071:2551-3192(-)
MVSVGQPVQSPTSLCTKSALRVVLPTVTAREESACCSGGPLEIPEKKALYTCSVATFISTTVMFASETFSTLTAVKSRPCHGCERAASAASSSERSAWVRSAPRSASTSALTSSGARGAAGVASTGDASSSVDGNGARANSRRTGTTTGTMFTRRETTELSTPPRAPPSLSTALMVKRNTPKRSGAASNAISPDGNISAERKIDGSSAHVVAK